MVCEIWLISGNHSGSRSGGLLALNLQQKPRFIRALFPTKISGMSVNAVARGRAIKSGLEYHFPKLYVVGVVLEF